MLKKIYNIQKVLLQNLHSLTGSGNKDISSGEKISSWDKYFAIALLVLSFIYCIQIDPSMISIVCATLGALLISGYATYNNGLITLLPTSKGFKFINLYLFGFFIFVVSVLINIIIGISIYVIYYLIIFVLLGEKAVSPSAGPYILSLEATVLVFFIVTTFYGILVTIMFVKNRVIRYSIGLTFSMGYFTLLYYIKSNFLYNPMAVFPNDMFYSFSVLKNKYSVLGFCGVFTLIVVISSLLIGYRLYAGRFSQNLVVKNVT